MLAVFQWLGYVILACLATAAIIGAIAVAHILAWVIGVIVAVAFFSMLFASYFEERRRQKRRMGP